MSAIPAFFVRGTSAVAALLVLFRTRRDRTVTDQGDLQAVDAFWTGLQQSVEAQDEADGWTEGARAASAEAMQRVREDLAAGWGEHADYASHHLLRVLDHWGVGVYSRGRLAKLSENAQAALIRLRAERS